MFQVLLIITGFLLTLQLLLAFASLWERRNLERRFAYPLGSRMSNADLLEIYSRVVRPINIKVNARIKQAAAVFGDAILINQRHVYRKDLYVTCYTIWLIKFTDLENLDVQRNFRFQGILFGLELILIVVAYLTGAIIVVATALWVAIMLFGFSYFMQLRYAKIVEEYHILAKDLLDLDPIESARAEILAEKLKTETFSYPFLPLIWIIRFISPL